MNTNVLARIIAAAAQVNPLAPIAQSQLRLPSQDGGPAVRGQVAARLADGSFRVLVDGKAVQIELPGDPQPGDTVELRLPTVVARAAAAPAPPLNDVEPHVSAAGRIIGRVLEQAAAQTPRQAAPITSVPPREGAELIAPLARAVERSGLFYESHQALWSRGAFPLARLMEEPQARLRTESTAHAARFDTTMPRQPERAASAAPAQDSEPSSMQARATTELAARDQGPPLPIAREALPLVRQQIESLEAQRIVWHGEVWPGQPMRWEIADERETRAHDLVEHDWSTQLSLTLPALGAVDCRIRLAGHGVTIELAAGDPATARMMRVDGPVLEQALVAAGLVVRRFEVDARERST